MADEKVSVFRQYRVSVERHGEAHALVSTGDHTLTLRARRGDPSAGFSAAETLLASLGTCLITNVSSLAARMRLPVDGVRVEINGCVATIHQALCRSTIACCWTAPSRPRSWKSCMKWPSSGAR